MTPGVRANATRLRSGGLHLNSIPSIYSRTGSPPGGKEMASKTGGVRRTDAVPAAAATSWTENMLAKALGQKYSPDASENRAAARENQLLRRPL
jgi:hypothetical protein